MIYICIPAFNEEQTVGVVLWKIRQVMADYPRDYQLLVVDDASTDKTPEVLAPYARVLPLTVVRTESRQGEGAALEMMLREAVRRSEYPKRDVVITLQADFTQEPDELVGLIKRMEAGADIVAGETGPASDAGVWGRWARRLAVRVLGRGRIPPGVRDPFTGYRAYRVAVVKGALADRKGRLVHWGGWAGAAELLLVTAPHARRVDTVELVERRERLQRPSRLRPWRALRDVWSLSREARPLQVASPAELDQAMRSIAAVRTSEVAARSGARPERGERPERTQRGERAGGSSEERRPREGSRGPRTAPGAARGGRGERASHAPGGERASHTAGGERSHKGGDSPRSAEPRKTEPGRAADARGRRKGEGRRTPPAAAATVPAAGPETAEPPGPLVAEVVTALAVPESAEKARRKRPRRRKRAGGAGGENAVAGAAAGAAPQDQATPGGSHALPAAGEPGGSGRQAASDAIDAILAELVSGDTASRAPADDTAAEMPLTGASLSDAAAAGEDSGQDETAADAARSRRRRRGRRGGRRRSGAGSTAGAAGDAAAGGGVAPPQDEQAPSPVEQAPSPVEQTAPQGEPAAPRSEQTSPSGDRADRGQQMGVFELIEGDRSHDS